MISAVEISLFPVGHSSWKMLNSCKIAGLTWFTDEDDDDDVLWYKNRFNLSFKLIES